jgi:E3 ubiquitin-protein ligase HUWE1
MGILDDFKKLFWAKKAVAKSTARKVGHETKEFAEESFEKIKDFGGKVADKAEDAFEDVKDYTSDIFDDIMKKKEPTTSTSASTSSSATTSTTKSDAAAPGEKKETVLDKAVEMSDKAWEKAEDLAGKAKEMAKKAGEKIEGKLDELYEKAKDLDKKIEAEREAIDPNKDGFADKPVSEKLREQGSLLKDKDDFWAKADAYSKGDYSMGKPVVVGKEKTDPAHDEKLDLKPVSEIKKKGDNLIDDAEIVEDTSNPEDDPDKPKNG